jgi:hypothetical protein
MVIYNNTMKTRTIEIMISIIFAIIMLSVLICMIILILSGFNKSVKDIEKACTRISINEFEDNCMCPCDELTWIEKKLNLKQLCDGWIVKKGESCIQSAISK